MASIYPATIALEESEQVKLEACLRDLRLSPTQCTQCGIVSGLLDDQQKVCTHCGKGKYQQVFMDLNADKFIRSIHYFYKTGRSVEGKLLAELVAEIETLGVSMTPVRFFEMHDLVNRKYDVRKPGDYSAIFNALGRSYGVKEQHRSDVLLAVMRYKMPDEYLALIVFSNSFLEVLLYWVMRRVCIQKQQNDFTDCIKDAKSFNKLLEIYNDLSGESLEQSLEKSTGDNIFWARWMQIMDRRNAFMHKTPYVFGRREVDLAVLVSIDATNSFVGVHNRLVTSSVAKKATFSS